MIEFSVPLANGAVVEGSYDPRFGQVAEAFTANFTQHGEVGASVCLFHKGRKLVDLWGGWADAPRLSPWRSDTISIVYSCTKAATALCLHKLVEQGLVSYETRVSDIWPEFAAGGKGATTVAMMLCHTSPVPHLREPFGTGRIVDSDHMVARVAAEPAFWEPGSRQGYHALTFAWTVGNLIRILSGKSLGRFFAENFAGPLDLDFHIGLPASEEVRVAPMIPPDPGDVDFESKFIKTALGEAGSLPQLFLAAQKESNFNTREVHAAEIGSANGITNARGLAMLYDPMARGGDGLLRPETVVRMSRVVAATLDDAVLRQPIRFALGFMTSNDNRAGDGDSLIIGESAFGHVGMGGSIGFADPDAKIGFGYTMNKMGAGILLNERGQGLIDAVYRALDWSSNATGAWRQ